MKNNFIDLFAGIGGIRAGFELAGFNCIYGSEIDRYSRETYKAFFGEYPDNDDITTVTKDKESIESTIPTHSILTAGFPCQPFSLAGVSKKNSMKNPHGFDDKTSGTMFFHIKKIIRVKKPDIIFLENVKNLRSHNGKKTYSTIMNSLAKPMEGLEYIVADKVIDASKWVPQHRERIFFVCLKKKKNIKKEINSDFIKEKIFPENPSMVKRDLSEILDDNCSAKYTLRDGTWNALKKHKAKHLKKGNGFGYGKINPPFKGKTTRTLSARYYKDGAEILIGNGENTNPRRLTPLECFKLQGFPEKYEDFFNGTIEQPVSDHQAYKQFGNAVAVPLIFDIAKNIKRYFS